MQFKRMMLKLKQKLVPAAFNSTDMNEYLRLNGIKVGKNCRFYRPSSITIDTTRPMLLEIGNYVKITSGVTILAHDYSRSVIRRVYGEIIGEAKQTIIGDNVFIGMNSVILMGTHVGDNVIIGAGSIVSGNVPSNSVIGGNPAKVIMALDDYYNRRKEAYIEEAKAYIRLFMDQRNRYPHENEMLAFWPLYAERDRNDLVKKGYETNLGGDEQEEVILDFLSTPKVYDSLEELIQEAERERETK